MMLFALSPRHACHFAAAFATAAFAAFITPLRHFSLMLARFATTPLSLLFRRHALRFRYAAPLIRQFDDAMLITGCCRLRADADC